MPRPARARGLKPVNNQMRMRMVRAAPRAGAWIETGDCRLDLQECGPRPARARGLKQEDPEIAGIFRMPRPARARGLKLACNQGRHTVFCAAPRAGAWIETVERMAKVQ